MHKKICFSRVTGLIILCAVKNHSPQGTIGMDTNLTLSSYRHVYVCDKTDVMATKSDYD